MKTRQRVVAGLAAFAIAILLLTSGGRVSTSGGMRLGLIIFAATSLTLLSLRATRWLTLRDRRVGVRLLVLLAFATLVPALLVGALGGAAAWLGAASDRAQAAANAFGREARGLHDELAVALRGGEGGEGAVDRLRTVAATHGRRGEPISVWFSDRDGAWTLLTGDSVVSVEALRVWSPDSANAAVLAVVKEAPYAAARAAAPSGALAAIAFVPADGALRDSIAGSLAAEIKLPRYSSEKRKRGRVTLIATETSGDSTRTGVAARTLDLLEDSPFRGFAALNSRFWTGEEWIDSNQYVTARLPFFASLSGLWRNAVVTPVAWVPLFFLSLFFMLGIRILVVNGQTLRAIGKSITSAVEALRGGVDALRAGRLEHRVPIAGSDELWDVAAGLNHAAEGLERARQAELAQARLKSDLELARRIQARLLPTAAPAVPGLEVAGLSLSALEVGGDYYDHVLLSDGRVALVTADVSGKGIPAALLMSAFRASLLGQLDAHSDPAHAMANVNRFLHRSVEPGRFVTAFLAIVDGRDGRIEYCNAGHNPPFLVDARGGATPLEAGGLLLAMMEDAPYEGGQARLEPGVTLVIYSDGAVEAKASDESMWGEERLCKQVREAAGEPCAKAAERIASTIRAFEGSQGPSDDLTLLLARRSS